jgi:hypothetical protein
MENLAGAKRRCPLLSQCMLTFMKIDWRCERAGRGGPANRNRWKIFEVDTPKQIRTRANLLFHDAYSRRLQILTSQTTKDRTAKQEALHAAAKALTCKRVASALRARARTGPKPSDLTLQKIFQTARADSWRAWYQFFLQLLRPFASPALPKTRGSRDNESLVPHCCIAFPANNPCNRCDLL